MDQGLKERLVGAAVLVAIAVWLIPWVLDGPESGRRNARAARCSCRRPRSRCRCARRRCAWATLPSRAPSCGDAGRTLPPRHRRRGERDGRARDARPRRKREPRPNRSRRASPSARPASGTAPRVRRRRRRQRRRRSRAAAATGDWTVQLGSFSEEANARRLAQRAGTFGYKAEVSSYRERRADAVSRARRPAGRRAPRPTPRLRRCARTASRRSRRGCALSALNDAGRLRDLVPRSGLGFGRCLARVHDGGAVAADAAGRDRLGLDVRGERSSRASGTGPRPARSGCGPRASLFL